jgi:uncharacterized protein (DUF697 family)/GTPase Era involved in 16S rRNA processing
MSLPDKPNEESLLASLLDLPSRAAEQIPGGSGASLKTDLLTLKELLMDARPPKLMIVGRRGAGKSSLVNAICGERLAAVGAVLSETGSPTWYSYRSPRGEMRILDTRGLGDRTRPESANFQSAIEEVKAAVASDFPDAILFLCKAKEVDALISQDIANVQEIRAFLRQKHRYDAPVVAVVTQVDELDPKRVEPPYDDETKRRNIDLAVETVGAALREAGVELAKVVPVSAYAEYQDDERAYDNFWNIDTLVEYLLEVLPESAQVQLARLSRLRGAQRRMARKLTATAAAVAAGIAAVPIPVADILPITATQIGLITGVAYLSGRELSTKSAREFLVALGVNLGGAFVLREAARALVKFVFPGGGSAISAGVAFAGTWAIGEAASAYFIDRMPIEEAKEVFRRKKKEKEEEKGEPG